MSTPVPLVTMRFFISVSATTGVVTSTLATDRLPGSGGKLVNCYEVDHATYLMISSSTNGYKYDDGEWVEIGN